jgi:hypothetical protein
MPRNTAARERKIKRMLTNHSRYIDRRKFLIKI